MTKEDKIIKKIYELCPELLELNRGCRVKTIMSEIYKYEYYCGKFHNDRVVIYATNGGETGEAYTRDIKKCKIIGQPIRLHDLMKSIDINNLNTGLGEWIDIKDILSFWNFQEEDNLAVQLEKNPELIEFSIKVFKI